MDRHGRDGFAILELLIAAGLAIVVMVMSYLVFVGSDRSFRTGQAAISAEADLRHAMDVVVQDVRQATQVSLSGDTMTLTMPTSIAAEPVKYVYDGSRLFRQQDDSSSLKLIGEEITTFTVTPTDGTTTVRLVTTRPRLQEDYELISKVTLRNGS